MGKSACLKYFNPKVQGSSILEVIVSMTICMIIFTISMRVILNIQSNNNLETKQRAILLGSRDMTWNDPVSAEIVKGIFFEDGNLELQSDTSTMDLMPELELVTQLVRLKNGRTVQKCCYYVRKSIKNKP